MSAGIYPFEIKRGATWSLGVAVFYKNGLPKDLTNYEPSMQIRSKSNNGIQGELILDLGSSYFESTATHAFKVEIGATDTYLISAGKYNYDLFLRHISDEDDVIDFLTGEVTVKESAIT